MSPMRFEFLSRGNDAFSSFAVTAFLSLFAILGLAFGVLQDSKAETTSGLAESAMLLTARVEDPMGEVDSAAGWASLPERRVEESRPQAMFRRAMVSPESIRPVRGKGPAQEWLGVSKLAFPLLVGDLVGGQSVRSPVVMTGRPVGAK